MIHGATVLGTELKDFPPDLQESGLVIMELMKQGVIHEEQSAIDLLCQVVSLVPLRLNPGASVPLDANLAGFHGIVNEVKLSLQQITDAVVFSLQMERPGEDFTARWPTFTA